MKRIVYISGLCLTLVLLGVTIVTIKENFISDAMDCRGVVKFHKDGQVLSFSLKQKINLGRGVVTLSGVLYSGEEPQEYISKTVSFHYVKNGDIYSLTSDNISDSPQITLTVQQQRQWLPLFFSQPGEVLNLEMDRQGLSDWVVSSDAVPLYLCEKSD